MVNQRNIFLGFNIHYSRVLFTLIILSLSFISTTLLSVIAILLASTAYTLFAPALMQKSDKIPVPAPTSSKNICRC